jgi:hypothetical protein
MSALAFFCARAPIAVSLGLWTWQDAGLFRGEEAGQHLFFSKAPSDHRVHIAAGRSATVGRCNCVGGGLSGQAGLNGRRSTQLGLEFASSGLVRACMQTHTLQHSNSISVPRSWPLPDVCEIFPVFPTVPARPPPASGKSLAGGRAITRALVTHMCGWPCGQRPVLGP